MRLTDRIHLVASGSGGFDLTDPFDCHAYLVDGGGAAALVDCGIGAAVDDLLRGVERAGVAPERLELLVLTHAHPDHCGAAAALRERLPGLAVAASPHVARVVEEADEEAMSLEAGKRAEFYPPDFRFAACPVDRRLGDGERVRVGDVALDAIHTPGHSAGHLALLGRAGDRVACFCGDLLFHGGRISLEANADCDLAAYMSSLRRLAGAGIDALLPGHREVTLWRGQRHVDAAVRRLDAGFVPPSLV